MNMTDGTITVNDNLDAHVTVGGNVFILAVEQLQELAALAGGMDALIEWDDDNGLVLTAELLAVVRELADDVPAAVNAGLLAYA